MSRNGALARSPAIHSQLHVHHGTVERVLAQAGLPRIGAPARRAAIGASRACIGCLMSNPRTTCRATAPATVPPTWPSCGASRRGFSHFCRELGIAPLQIVAHLVRLHLLLVEEFAHRACARLARHGYPSAGPCARA